MKGPTRCGCGCGEYPRAGRRFRQGHHSRLRTKSTRAPTRFDTCPRCGRKVRLRADGSFGKHDQRGGLAPVPCVQGQFGKRPAPQGVRVRVALDVIVPVTWSQSEFQRIVREVLQERANDAFLVAVETYERADGAA